MALAAQDHPQRGEVLRFVKDGADGDFEAGDDVAGEDAVFLCCNWRVGVVLEAVKLHGLGDGGPRSNTRERRGGRSLGT